MNWYPRIMLRKYASFSGRARRKEYWMFFLVYALLSGSITAVVMGLDWVVDFVTRGRWADSFSLEAGLTLGVFALVHLLPSIAVTVRRLHDTGRSGWWILLSFIPIIGALVLLYFMVISGEPQDNAYGPNPKAA